jgi:hypothetical protein
MLRAANDETHARCRLHKVADAKMLLLRHRRAQGGYPHHKPNDDEQWCTMADARQPTVLEGVVRVGTPEPLRRKHAAMQVIQAPGGAAVAL